MLPPCGDSVATRLIVVDGRCRGIDSTDRLTEVEIDAQTSLLLSVPRATFAPVGVCVCVLSVATVIRRIDSINESTDNHVAPQLSISMTTGA